MDNRKYYYYFAEKMDNLSSSWKRLLRLLKLDSKDIFQIFGYAIFSGLVSLSLPIGIQAIIGLIQGAKVTTSWIVLIVLVTLGVIFSGVLQLMQMRVLETIQQRIFTRTSFELSYRFPKMAFESIRGYYPPELANRFFDTLIIQKGLSKLLLDIPFALLQIFFALIILSFYNTFFIIFGVFLIFIFYFTFRYSTKKGITTSLKESKHKYKVAHWIQEVARVAVSFKTSGNTKLALDKNNLLVKDYLVSRESHFKVIIIQFLKMIGFKAVVTAGLLILGGFLVLNQQMNIGQFVASEIIILLIINAVEKLISGLESVYDTLTSVEKLGQVTDIDLDTQSGDQPDLSAGFRISLQSVFYRVPDFDNLVVKGFSQVFDPNATYLITGEMASGKSVLLKLISGLIPASNGNVFVGDYRIGSLLASHYRSYISTCFYEETPFEGTFKENVTLNNPNIAHSHIMEVLELLGLKSFLAALPKGLYTMICAEGKHLSNRIARRIILARAILRNKQWLLLEDLNLFLDPPEQLKVFDYLCTNNQKVGLIIASNDEVLVDRVDHHIVLPSHHSKTV